MLKEVIMAESIKNPAVESNQDARGIEQPKVAGMEIVYLSYYYCRNRIIVTGPVSGRAEQRNVDNQCAMGVTLPIIIVVLHRRT